MLAIHFGLQFGGLQAVAVISAPLWVRQCLWSQVCERESIAVEAGDGGCLLTVQRERGAQLHSGHLPFSNNPLWK